HGVDVARPSWLHARRAVGFFDADMRICGIGWRLCARERLQLSWQGQRLRKLDNLYGLGWIRLEHGRPWGVVITDFLRPPARAGGERHGGQQWESEWRNTHQPSSLDQLKAWT